jgi:methionine-rich copper-binding protein CopC
MRKAFIAVFFTALSIGGSQALAHINVTGNLNGQKFEQAPEIAEFFAEGEIEPGSAKAQIRYLGDVSVNPELYFKRDVPTSDLEIVESPKLRGASFAFYLPKLAKGTYAVDWEVSAVGDHPVEAVSLFEVTVGSDTPDKVPGIPARVLVDGELKEPTERDTGVQAVLYVMFMASLSGIGAYMLYRKGRA